MTRYKFPRRSQSDWSWTDVDGLMRIDDVLHVVEAKTHHHSEWNSVPQRRSLRILCSHLPSPSCFVYVHHVPWPRSSCGHELPIDLGDRSLIISWAIWTAGYSAELVDWDPPDGDRLPWETLIAVSREAVPF